MLGEFKSELDKIFVQNKEYGNFIITIMSFGFKYGIPRDSDIVQDVRFLPNPYYDEKLRPLTGNDKAIQDYVMDCKEGPEFLDKFIELVQFLIPNYIREGKNQLVISIGCTGGKHRSVTIANEVYSRLQKSTYTVRIVHRDIGKDAIVKNCRKTGVIKMSFSSEVKAELAKNISNARHCRIAELSGMMSMVADVWYRNGKLFKLCITTERSIIAGTMATLMKLLFGIHMECSVKRTGRDSRIYRMVVDEPKTIERILMTLKLKPDDRMAQGKIAKISCQDMEIDRMVVQQQCCKRAFIKGMFMTSGSVSNPQKGYHLEIVCDNEERAALAEKNYGRFGCGKQTDCQKEIQRLLYKRRYDDCGYVKYHGSAHFFDEYGKCKNPERYQQQRQPQSELRGGEPE